jgi:hypothetical protein
MRNPASRPYDATTEYNRSRVAQLPIQSPFHPTSEERELPGSWCEGQTQSPETGEEEDRTRGGGHLKEFLVLLTKSVQVIVMPACLTDTIRSHSFSLSQRFEPTRTSWPCFMPHPPIGFLRRTEFFSHPAGHPRRAPNTLLVMSWRRSSRRRIPTPDQNTHSTHPTRRRHPTPLKMRPLSITCHHPPHRGKP